MALSPTETTKFNPYEVLGVAPSAPLEDIERAYRRAAAKAHPDRDGGSTEAMTDVNMAWKILSDPEMRARFDKGENLAVPPLDVRARSLILQMLSIAIRNCAIHDDLVEVLRAQVRQQRTQLQQARFRATTQLAELKMRLRKLKGPEGNFIAGAIESEISKGEESLPLLDSDEQMQVRALEILNEYSYGDFSTIMWSSVSNPTEFSPVKYFEP